MLGLFSIAATCNNEFPKYSPYPWETIKLTGDFIDIHQIISRTLPLFTSAMIP
jgi:hypothetical protein